MTGGLVSFAAANNLGSGTITLDGGGLQWATGNTLDISSRLAPLGAGGGTFDTNGNNVTLASTISGAGALPVRAANDTVRAGLSHRPRTRSMVEDRTVEPYRFSRGHAEPQAAAVAGPDRRPVAAAAEGRAAGRMPRV